MSDSNNFQTLLTPKHYNKLVNLVPPKSVIQYYIWNRICANVSLTDKNSLQQWYPDIQIRDMYDLLSDVSGFEVRWGSQNKLPFIGWVELKVSSTSSTNPDMIPPFLVTPDTTFTKGRHPPQFLSATANKRHSQISTFDKFSRRRMSPFRVT